MCHIIDNTNLYISILRAILDGGSSDPPPSGKKGYYLAASGSVAWTDIYAAMARALAQRGVVDDDTVTPASDEVRGEMGKALGYPKQLVGLQIGGL